MNFVGGRGMARPTIDIPEATRTQVIRVRREGSTLKEISGKTGIKYHLVRRILAEAEAPARVEILHGSDETQRPPAVGQSVFTDSKPWDEVPKGHTVFGKKPRKIAGRDDGRGLGVREGERHGHWWSDRVQVARAQREYELLVSPEYERNQKLSSEIETFHLQTEWIKASQEL